MNDKNHSFRSVGAKPGIEIWMIKVRFLIKTLMKTSICGIHQEHRFLIFLSFVSSCFARDGEVVHSHFLQSVLFAGCSS